ncbi:hypothetical protein [Flavobacterium sp.]|uniref:hypothetical protein n=1 Tax=Flavobacterium sp. TaxID=239 RepID=UPI0025FC1185|nr:hypothetical protein [Flavobacterium sp.]
MKKEKYTYCLLKYNHSQFLGELVNIAILVYFNDTKKLYFECPDRLIRLKFTYLDIPEKTIKSYLRSIKEKVLAINKDFYTSYQFSLENGIDKFIESEILLKDSTCLEFGESKVGLKYIEDERAIVGSLYNQFFSYFDNNNIEPDKIDEGVLLNKYKTLLKKFDKSVLDKSNKNIYFDYKINPTDKTEFKFDIAWQNGSLNLVKPISFDVKKPTSIQNKSYRFYGEFIDLEAFASSKNYKFDLLISKPSSKDLFKYYDNAIKLLSKPKNVEIILDENIEEYSKKTAKSVLDNNALDEPF